MDRERVMARVEQLLKEKHMSMNALMKETEISTTMYQLLFCQSFFKRF